MIVVDYNVTMPGSGSTVLLSPTAPATFAALNRVAFNTDTGGVYRLAFGTAPGVFSRFVATFEQAPSFALQLEFSAADDLTELPPGQGLYLVGAAGAVVSGSVTYKLRGC